MKLTAKKSLGQHFLKSPSVLQKIMDTAGVKSDEIIIEIGPGTGILTDELLKKGARMIAVEKDARAMAPLQARFDREYTSGKLALIQKDILELDRHTLGLAEGNFAVVANIPYYITGAILESFLEKSPRPNRMILLVQKEVAERIVGKKESILSISVKAFGTPKLVSRVPRGAFLPPPTVESAILEITKISDRRFREKSIDIRRFFEVLKAGFAHKRKFLIRNLEVVADSNTLSHVWSRVGIPQTVRAEDISLEKWLEIVALL